VSRAVLTLILLACLTFLAGLGRQAITDSDEGYYAEAAREMVESGDWLTPHYNYEYRWEKPVLYYWLAAATYLVGGASESAARFWSALAGIGLVLLTWSIARSVRNQVPRSIGEPDKGRPTWRSDETTSAWLAGAIAATSFGYFAEARLALPDLLLAFWINLTIWAALRAGETGRVTWWILAGVGAGLGLLTKGPVALVLPAIVILPCWWLARARSRVSVRGIAVAIGVCLVVGVPWYVAMWLVHGTHYLRVFFLENNVQRFATEQYNGPRPIWFYIPMVLGGLIPWSAYLVTFVVASVVDLWRGPLQVREASLTRLAPPAKEARRASWADVDWPLVLWAVMPLLFYTASVGKQPRYILPVLPPLAILVARGVVHRIEPGVRRQTALSVATWTTAAVLAACAVLLLRAQPLFINSYPAVTWLASGGMAVSALAVAWTAVTRRWRLLPVLLACTSAVLLLAIQFGALAGKRPEAVEEMASLVRSHRGGSEPVGEYHAFVRNLIFYLGFKQVDLFDAPAAEQFVRSPERVLLVASTDDVAALQKTTGVSLRVLGSVRYLNAADLKIRTILAPDPERDVETILLVSNR
jgi:4-amino-4-deoxy-L-arabinose transferase-like glycosyltransferase